MARGKTARIRRGRRSPLVSKSAKKKNHTAANDNRAAAGKRAAPPSAELGGVDYGPAVAALSDLIAWAFDLASADVADWPEGRRRVRATRKYVRARLHGTCPRGVPYEDVLFTAGLLARIFEAEVGLDMSAMVAVLDQIGLPTEVVPLMPRDQPHAHIPVGAPVFPDRMRPVVRAVPAPCQECGQVARYRNAA